MLVSWSTISSITLCLGPILYPRAVAFYRSLRTSSSLPPAPLSIRSTIALNILFISAVLALISTLPFFTPANIFHQTSTRLQTPTNLIFKRLADIAPLTSWDEALKTTFEAGGLEARLLYLRFGPDVLATCQYADPKAIDAATTYMIYALPTLLAPHVLHTLALGVATSGPVAGREGERWRTLGTIAGVALAVVDLGMVYGYDHRRNARAGRTEEVEMFYWRARVVRGLCIGLVDALLGWVMWMAATRRAFVKPKGGAERVEDATRVAEMTLGKLKGMGVLRNAVFRDTQLRGNMDRYWARNEQVMRGVREDGEVSRAMNQALEEMDVVALQRQAENLVDSIVPTAVQPQ